MNRLKQVFGIAGMLVALAGFALQSRPLIWAAIGLLGLSILLRLFIRIAHRHAESEPRDE
ncbi:MAG TPA: hypothetical protein VFO95_10420 [Gemmatimonadales bacterium]|nr:hypothetical protein [Gemmatimonadales bacterium]